MITNVQLVVRELTPGTAEYDRAASVEADLETFIAEVRAAQLLLPGAAERAALHGVPMEVI